MSEDYTYTTLVNWRTRAHELAATVNTQAARVAELEAQLNAAVDASIRMEGVHATVCRENIELRAKLAAVPVDAIELVHWGDSTSFGYVEAVGMVGNWLVSVSELTPTIIEVQAGRSTARLALDAERATQRAQELERENAELRAKLDSVTDDLADVLEIAIARGDSLGYCDDDYRQWLEQLRPESTAIAFEVTE